MLYLRFNRFVAEAIVVNLDTYWSSSLPIAIPWSFLSLLSSVLRCPFPPRSRSIRSIVRRTSWHVSKCGKKGEASEYCCVRVGKSFTPPSRRWGKKNGRNKKCGVYCSHIWRFLLPPRHRNAHCLCILYTRGTYTYFLWMEMLDVKSRRTTLVSKWRHK